MTKNPFYNALAALLYIVLIVLGMTAISSIHSSVDEIIMPIIMLSLFTLSTAVMAYIFGYQPLRLFLEEKKKEAVSLFLKTVGIFGVITIILITIYLLLIA
jgi:Na+/serine symporter